MPDFTKGKIYKITNDFNNDIYIGSTCDKLTKRFSHHKAVIKREIQRPLYKLMDEIGFERFRIELIEDYPCQDKYELRQKESDYIRKIGTLNIKIDDRTPKEYKQENKEKISAKKKEYYEDNKEKIKVLDKQKYEEKKKHIKHTVKNIMTLIKN